MDFCLKARIEEWLLTEHTRWMLWIPILIACGVILYFRFDLPIYTGFAFIGSGASALVFWKRWPWVRALLAMIFLLGIGICAIQWQENRLWQPLLDRPTAILSIEADLEEVIHDEGKQKLVLSDIAVEGGTRSRIPQRIRLSLKKPDNRLRAGQRIRLRGGMFPLPEPASPRGFDFTRHFYFKHIGAVGFGLAPVEILEDQTEAQWQITLSNFRADLGKQIMTSLEPEFGTANAAIATALITGERAGIPEETKEHMRAAGLAHMLAISGLHLGLVTGVIFLLLRYIFLLMPGFALRYPIKKWAAVGALIGGFAYLILANFPVSAQRAYVMVALILFAVILDRQVLSMRSLALAAIMILLIMPASVMGPSFQLSFAATMSIIALYEWYRKRKRDRDEDIEERAYLHYGFRRKIWLYISGVLMTTFVASLITSPYTIFHFNQFTNYHLIANLAASPVFSFLVMPAGVGAMLLTPLGWEQPFLWLMGQSIEWVTQIAAWVASLPDAMIHMPTPPLWALGLFSFGACWFCFWQERPRHLGWLMMLIATIPFLTTRTPDILISAEAEQIALRNVATAKEGESPYIMYRGSIRNFKAELWMETLGVESFAKPTALGESLHCDGGGCIWHLNEHLRIALPKRRDVAMEDCLTADATITSFHFDCADETALVIDRPGQPISLRLSGSELTLESTQSFTSMLAPREAKASAPGSASTP